MAISLIPQKKKKRAIGSNIGDFLAVHRELRPVLITFLVFALAWAGLLIWANFIKSDIKRVRDEQSAILSAVEQREIIEAQDFAGRVRALNSIVSSRAIVSGLFSEFENSIHPQVSIASFDLTISRRSLSLSGTAGNFEALAQQFVIWDNETDFVESVILKGFSRTAEGTISFSVDIIIRSGYLK